MAIVVHTSRRGTNMETYHEATRLLRERSVYPRAEMLFLVAYGDPDDVELFIVWENREAFERFLNEDMPPAAEGSGIDTGDLDIYEVQDLVVSSQGGVTPPV
jgi:hypothetical protein